MHRPLTPFQRWLCERTEPAPDHVEVARDLHHDFQRWCDRHGFAALPAGAFLVALSDARIPHAGLVSRDGMRVHLRRGVALKPEPASPEHGRTGLAFVLVAIAAGLVLFASTLIETAQ